MEWRRATRVLGLCHSCRSPIGPGDIYAKTRREIVRCRRCALKVEPEPPSVVDDPPAFMPSITQQPSLALDGDRRHADFVSVGDLAKRRAANHLRQWRRR